MYNQMGFRFDFIVSAMIFASTTKSSTSSRNVEMDLIDSQLQLFDDVVAFVGAMGEDVRNFLERPSSSATAEEAKTRQEVAEKFKAFKNTMNIMLMKNNLFVKKLFDSACPEKTEHGRPSKGIKLGQDLLSHRVQIKKLFVHHLNEDGMQLWKLLGGSTSVQNDTIQSSAKTA